MFEKEAEEYYENVTVGTFQECTENFADAVLTAYKDGAEFGYNKANEWHYPSKGKYPKELESVWCYCKGLGFKFCCVGHIIIGGDNKVRWRANNKTEELCVIAWKEIVLPKESE